MGSNSGKSLQTSNDQAPTITSELQSPLFALLIGINEYESQKIRNLTGAVADAAVVGEYLRTVLKTPSSHIEMLQDKLATRNAIIKAINDLSTDTNIQKGDAILIYFAGHGTKAVAPVEWQTYCKQTELIVPYDANIQFEGKAGTKDEDENKDEGRDKNRDESGSKSINLISDRELAYYLSRIAQSKGNNITVILDSCHSGSGTREILNDNRGIDNIAPILLDLNRDVWAKEHLPQVAGRASFAAGGFADYSETSHVLFAACQPEQVAREEGKRGVFTKALFDALICYGTELTCEDLLKKMDHSGFRNQTPQCEGMKKDSFIFGGKTPRLKPYIHDVVRNDAGEYHMKAGRAHGINEDAKYRLFRDRASYYASNSLGIMIAKTVEEERTLLEWEHNQQMDEVVNRSGLWAVQVSAARGEILPVYAGDDEIRHMLQSLILYGDRFDRPWQIRLVDKEYQKEAFVGLSLSEDNFVSIDIMDEKCCSFGMGRLTRRLEVTPKQENDHKLSNFLEVVTHFRRHLKIEKRCPLGQDAVEIEFSALVRKEPPHTLSFLPDYRLKTAVTPEGGESVINLIRPGTDPNYKLEGSEVRLEIKDECGNHNEVKTKERYGLTIRNKTSQGLYTSVFFFCMSNFEISIYYEPPSVGTDQHQDISASIPANLGQELAIGHGPGGRQAWQYGLTSGEDIDVGFIKLFLSTKPLRLSHIKQDSAFEGLPRHSISDRSDVPFVWWTMTIPVIQTRSLPSS